MRRGGAVVVAAAVLFAAAPAGSGAAPGSACVPAQVAVAHHGGGAVLRPQPVGAPVACEATTGFGGAETQVVVTNDGAVVYEPAILAPGVAGTGFLAGAPGPRLNSQISPSGLAVSRDRGRAWSFVRPAGVTWVGQDDSLYVDRATGRTFFYALAANPAPQAGIGLLDQVPAGYAHLLASPDDGRTWTQTAVPGFIESENPRFTAAPPPRAQVGAAGYPNVVYWCGNNMLFTETYRACYRSFDGGESWQFASVLFSQPVPQHRECGPTAETFNSADGNYPQGAADGSLYVLVNCGATTFLARSTDEGQTWPIFATIPSTQELRVDPAGNLYGFSLATPTQLQLRVSRDHGVHWSHPEVLNAPGAGAVLQWAVAERGAGEVAASYLAARADGTAYDGYVTVTRDGLDADPTWWSARINGPSTPMYTGSPPQARDDFVGVDIGPDGTPWAGFFGSCLASTPDPACQGQAGNPEANESVAGWMNWPAR